MEVGQSVTPDSKFLYTGVFDIGRKLWPNVDETLLNWLQISWGLVTVLPQLAAVIWWQKQAF